MKSQRHFAIVDILSRERIATQEEMCEALKKEGFDVTQATVSRDIKELQLVKVPDNEGYRYALPENTAFRNTYERMKRTFQDSVVSINSSENLIVIKTLPGTANSVASMVDGSGVNSILGTLAGDDTILVVIKPMEAVEEVKAEFLRLLR